MYAHHAQVLPADDLQRDVGLAVVRRQRTALDFHVHIEPSAGARRQAAGDPDALDPWKMSYAFSDAIVTGDDLSSGWISCLRHREDEAEHIAWVVAERHALHPREALPQQARRVNQREGQRDFGDD